jgi:Flp pilus assembly protein TadD
VLAYYDRSQCALTYINGSNEQSGWQGGLRFCGKAHRQERAGSRSFVLGKMLGGVSAATRLLCILAIPTLAGCSGPTYPDMLPFHSEGLKQITPGDTGPSLRFARAARDSGDLAAAMRLYKTLVAMKSVDPEVRVEYGEVLLAANMPDDAIDSFSQVPAGSPAHLGALLGQTKAYLTLGEPAKSLEFADQALALAPSDERVLVDRGVVLDSLDRHAEAQASYRAVLAAAPRQVSARNNLALSLAVTGQFDEAVALLTPLVRSSEATPRIRENLALVYGLMGDADSAAMLSRSDLDDSSIRANLEFMAAVRGGGRS